MKYLICGILGIAIGFFVFYLLFRIANKDKLCKKLQDGSKKKLPKPNFTKLVLVAVLFTYFVGLYIGIKVTLIDYSQFGGLATYIANANSIGIEMCCTAGNYRISDRTKENAAYLCAFLCKMLGIGAGGVDSYVLRHYDVTGKNCPAQMVSNPTEWQEFKNKVKGILGGSVSAGGQQHTAQPTTDNVASYKVKITADVLNVRIGPGTDYGVATQVKQGEVYTIVGEVRNGNTTWGKLKSGAGYISLGYTERIAGMTANTPQDTSYRVKINTAVLNVRKGPGTNYPVTTQVKQGEVYTIVGEEKNGNTTWGKLKSGAGYISLGYTQRA